MHRLSFVALVVVAVCCAVLPLRLRGQENSQTPKPEVSPFDNMQSELGLHKKALLSESQDLEAMMRSLKSPDQDAAIAIDQRASLGAMELDATIWFAGIYENMQCDADREVAKAALKNRLGFYAQLLDLEAETTAKQLALTRVPAVAQSGQRIKEHLRAAKATLDEMAASVK